MEFRIADTFSDSLSRLTAQEQKAVKTTAFDLQLNPSSPGLSFHKLERVKDPNFWSVRVNADIRLIVHRTQASLLLVYVNHHDDAYKWAERRKIERHPTTGAMQLVEIRERVEEAAEPRQRAPSADDAQTTQKPALFDNLRKYELMAFGVPEEWVDDVRDATEDTLFDIITHLPQEAQEALLKLAVGEAPQPVKAAVSDDDPFAHPDAQRRFRVLTNVDELAQALDYPWEKWAVFLHPEQRQHAERRYSGPARVTGSAGTGKTVVALHRAVHLARRDDDASILLTTFSTALANALNRKLHYLVGNEADLVGRITVRSIKSIAYSLHSDLFGQPNIATPSLIQSLLPKAASMVEGHGFAPSFLAAEWNEVVDAWQIDSWDAYRDVSRLGRKTRIGGKQREILWDIFANMRRLLAERHASTWPDVFGRLTQHYAKTGRPPFDYAIVDEAQDLGVAEARFLAVATSHQSEGLFFAGDQGQRIFQQPFSWKSLGIDVRGRSQTLRINYRTSHQIRSQADRLLPTSIADVDGNNEDRRGTISVFDGVEPEIRIFDTPDEECDAVATWLRDRHQEGFLPHEIGVFVRSQPQLRRARAALKQASMPFVELSDKVETETGNASLSIMHLAKGLEFRAVVVMACDDEVLPLQERIESVADVSDLEEVYNTERHLLYVACTRARDRLLITGTDPASEFLEDLER